MGLSYGLFRSVPYLLYLIPTLLTLPLVFLAYRRGQTIQNSTLHYWPAAGFLLTAVQLAMTAGVHFLGDRGNEVLGRLVLLTPVLVMAPWVLNIICLAKSGQQAKPSGLTVPPERNAQADRPRTKESNVSGDGFGIQAFRILLVGFLPVWGTILWIIVSAPDDPGRNHQFWAFAPWYVIFASGWCVVTIPLSIFVPKWIRRWRS